MPCSPALAASMAAFSARRLVCSDMADMISVIPPIFFTESVSVSTFLTTISKAFLISSIDFSSLSISFCLCRL